LGGLATQGLCRCSPIAGVIGPFAATAKGQTQRFISPNTTLQFGGSNGGRLHMLCPRRRPQLSESMTDMVRRAPDSQGRPGKKPPRDPKRLRAKLKKARSKLLFETACKSARSLVTPADRSAVGEPFLTHVPHDRPSAYSWADDRALHEANSLGVYSLEETSGQTGQSHPAQPARQLDFTPFPEVPAPTEEQVKRVRTYLELVEDRETVVRHIARRRARK
jgi:hypothetical protein